MPGKGVEVGVGVGSGVGVGVSVGAGIGVMGDMPQPAHPPSSMVSNIPVRLKCRLFTYGLPMKNPFERYRIYAIE